MSMCRLNVVKSARKAPGKCQSCGTEIEAGQPYRWWKGRYTGKRVRCMQPGCMPQYWELETNATKQEDMQGASAHTNATASTDAATAAAYLREAIDLAQGLVDQLQERIDNKAGTSLEQSSEVEALQQSHGDYEQYVTTAETVADELEAMDEPPSENDFDPQSPDYSGEDDPESAANDAYELELSVYEGEVEEKLSELEDWPDLDLGQYGPPAPRRKRKALAEANPGEDSEG